MNKQELIERIEDLPYTEGPIADTITINRNWILESIKQLDEREKVQIPQFVADWLKENDLREETLGEQSVFDVFDSLKNDSKNGYYENVKRWIDENGDLFARAWLDGYEVEKEKRYLVSLKNGQPLVKTQSGSIIYFSQNITAGNYKVTKKELEKAGFGWVFDCQGVEVEEV